MLNREGQLIKSKEYLKCPDGWIDECGDLVPTLAAVGTTR